MFAKPEWFRFRTMGWGISPCTWQGWLYVLCYMAALNGVRLLPLSRPMQLMLILVVVCLLLIDMVHVWLGLRSQRDERDLMHTLIIERNCAYTAVTMLVLCLLWQVFAHLRDPGREPAIDGALILTLVAMSLTKLVSTIYLRRRM